MLNIPNTLNDDFNQDFHHIDFNQVETDLSKYSLDDDKGKDFVIDESPGHSNGSMTTSSESISGSSDELSVTTDEQLYQNSKPSHNSLQLAQNFDQILLDHELNNGRIHGHIHNFENFTYIHGHIHTSDDTVIPGINYLDDTINDYSPANALSEECHHFEFLNCHDHLQSKEEVVLEDASLICQEDENCKPRIVEICCDNDHDHNENNSFTDDKSNDSNLNSQTGLEKRRNSLVSFIPNLPNCTELLCDDIETSDPLLQNFGYIEAGTTKSMLDACKVDTECIDIKCDLDTLCDFDEIFCQVCDKDTEDTKVNVKLEEQEHSLDNHHKHLHSTSHHNNYQPQHHHHHHHHKRNRDEENETLHHHLHHSHSQHSVNHHHHHIQFHDHGAKKTKLNIVKPKEEQGNIGNNNRSESLINFEFNFKNEESICEWDSCFTSLDNSFQLQNHILENHVLHHGQEVNNEVQKLSNSPSKCEWKDCDFETMDLLQLVNHINSEHVNLIAGKIHKEQNNLQKELETETEEQTTCHWLDDNKQKCNMTFNTTKELTDHVISDHIGCRKSQYVCNWENCPRNGKVFNQKQKIVRHLHVHTHYKPFRCSICNHSFGVEYMLEQHMRTHSGEKPYSCKTCGKCFATAGSLSIHIRVHTGEKPLVCKYPGCGKKFSESSNLTKHLKTHEKEFKCTCCSKSFGKEKQLANHMAKYHEGVKDNEVSLQRMSLSSVTT